MGGRGELGEGAVDVCEGSARRSDRARGRRHPTVVLTTLLLVMLLVVILVLVILMLLLLQLLLL